MIYYEEQDFLKLAPWMQDEGRVAFEQYLALSPDGKEAVPDYLSELPLYEELSLCGRDYLFTHTGLLNFHPKCSLAD